VTTADDVVGGLVGVVADADTRPLGTAADGARTGARRGALLDGGAVPTERRPPW
jgi:hypothetical protein